MSTPRINVLSLRLNSFKRFKTKNRTNYLLINLKLKKYL